MRQVELNKNVLLTSGMIETGQAYWINTTYLSRVVPEYDNVTPAQFKSKLGWVGKFFDTAYDRDLAWKRLSYCLKVNHGVKVSFSPHKN